MSWAGPAPPAKPLQRQQLLKEPSSINKFLYPKGWSIPSPKPSLAMTNHQPSPGKFHLSTQAPAPLTGFDGGEGLCSQLKGLCTQFLPWTGQNPGIFSLNPAPPEQGRSGGVTELGFLSAKGKVNSLGWRMGSLCFSQSWNILFHSVLRMSKRA